MAQRRSRNRRSSRISSINKSNVLDNDTNIVDDDDDLWYDRSLVRPSTSLIFTKNASSILSADSTVHASRLSDKWYNNITQSDSSKLEEEDLKNASTKQKTGETHQIADPNTESESEHESQKKRSKFRLNQVKNNKIDKSNAFLKALEKTTDSHTRNLTLARINDSESTNDDSRTIKRLRPRIFQKPERIEENNFDNIFDSTGLSSNKSNSKTQNNTTLETPTRKLRSRTINISVNTNNSITNELSRKRPALFSKNGGNESKRSKINDVFDEESLNKPEEFGNQSKRNEKSKRNLSSESSDKNEVDQPEDSQAKSLRQKSSQETKLLDQSSEEEDIVIDDSQTKNETSMVNKSKQSQNQSTKQHLSQAANSSKISHKSLNKSAKNIENKSVSSHNETSNSSNEESENVKNDTENSTIPKYIRRTQSRLFSRPESFENNDENVLVDVESIENYQDNNVSTCLSQKSTRQTNDGSLKSNKNILKDHENTRNQNMQSFKEPTMITKKALHNSFNKSYQENRKINENENENNMINKSQKANCTINQSNQSTDKSFLNKTHESKNKSIIHCFEKINKSSKGLQEVSVNNKTIESSIRSPSPSGESLQESEPTDRSINSSNQNEKTKSFKRISETDCSVNLTKSSNEEVNINEEKTLQKSYSRKNLEKSESASCYNNLSSQNKKTKSFTKSNKTDDSVNVSKKSSKKVSINKERTAQKSCSSSEESSQEFDKNRTGNISNRAAKSKNLTKSIGQSDKVNTSTNASELSDGKIVNIDEEKTLQKSCNRKNLEKSESASCYNNLSSQNKKTKSFTKSNKTDDSVNVSKKSSKKISINKERTAQKSCSSSEESSQEFDKNQTGNISNRAEKSKNLTKSIGQSDKANTSTNASELLGGKIVESERSNRIENSVDTSNENDQIPIAEANQNKSIQQGSVISNSTSLHHTSVLSDNMFLQTPHPAQSTLNPRGRPINRITQFFLDSSTATDKTTLQIKTPTPKTTPLSEISHKLEQHENNKVETSNKHRSDKHNTTNVSEKRRQHGDSEQQQKDDEEQQENNEIVNTDVMNDNEEMESLEDQENYLNHPFFRHSDDDKVDCQLTTRKDNSLRDLLEKLKKKTDAEDAKILARLKREEEIKREQERKKDILNKKLISYKAHIEAEANKKKKKPINEAYLVDGKKYRPKLPRPANWVTDRLYKHLWKSIEPKYGLKKRVKSEKLIKKLSDFEKKVKKTKKYENYKESLDDLLKTMAKYNVIETRYDFYRFCSDYMPKDFFAKAVPMRLPGGDRNYPYDPDLVFKPILDNSKDSECESEDE